MEEWKEYRLGDLFERVTRKNINLESKNVLTISAQHGLINQEEFFNKSVAGNNLTNYYLLKKGEFAYNKSYSAGYPMGATKMLEKYDEGIVSTLYICFKKKSNIVNNEFFKYFFESNGYYNELSKIVQEGSRNHGLLNVSANDFFNIKIKIPSIKEQEKIVTILNIVDNIIDYNTIKMKSVNTYRKYVENQIFTYGIERSGSRDSEVGKIPVKWNLQSLMKITDYVDYRGKTPRKSTNGRFLVTAKNIRKGFIDYTVSKEYIEENSYEEVMSRGKVKIGDVLVTTEAPCGNIAQVDDDKIALAQRVIKYRGKENIIDNKYLKYYMLGDNFQKRLQILSTGGTAQGIKGSTLHKMLIAYPTINEQKYISNIFDKFEKTILLLSKKLYFYNDLKKYLMKQLLTGKIKVKI